MFDDQVEGRNAVLELLESGKNINKIYVQKEKNTDRYLKLLQWQKRTKLSL